MMLGEVVHACNPRHSGGRYWEDHGSKPAQAKSYPDPVSTNKPSMVMLAYSPGYVRSIDRKITVQVRF
jgi:hypothetical protein